ncbi:Glycerol-3-phosphate dehydrogenase [NAD(P)+] [Folsomia candida]|uniref:Glycerol-3-phosphate dehydrogenase [NAD(P)+] n=1 Tax=Folsomia candida TaxID=158441 RepID=A0A226D5N1_FOLCA|nr:Glycerol-3-phosphate dehydrogenase [NAD(P)+] [Folsomia candida]
MEENFNTLSYYDGESSDFENEGVPPPPKRRRQAKNNWEKLETFDNFEAKVQIKLNGTFVRHTAKELQDGKKIYYNFKIKDCPGKVHLYLPGNSQIVNLLTNGKPHDHDGEGKHGIPSEAKEIIDSLRKDGITQPKLIQTNLRRQGIDPPSRTQISNRINYLNSKDENRIVSLGQISDLCRRSSEIPTQMDDAFVAGYSIEFEIKRFSLFMSTKRLLSMTSQCKLLQADATYKLNWEGFPVLVVGTSDKDSHFHPFGIAITSGETVEDFSSVFQVLKGYDENFEPEVLVADCAEAITNAFQTVFRVEFKRVYCWFHVKQNVKKFLKSSKIPESQKKGISFDIDCLQLADNEEEFNIAKKLFIKKWKTGDTKDFYDYFETEYLNQRNGWYEGYAPGYPCTNNGPEAINATIKNENTFRKRLPLGELFVTLKKIVSGWSLDRNPVSLDCKIFATSPTYSLQLQTKSFNWSIDKKRAPLKSKKGCPGTVVYYITPSGLPALKSEDIIQYNNKMCKKTWTKFDTYKKCKERLWIVNYNEEEWSSSRCNYTSFKKKYMCKHVMGIAVIRKDFTVRDEAVTVPVGTKRPRGRPAKARRALLVD